MVVRLVWLLLLSPALLGQPPPTPPPASYLDHLSKAKTTCSLPRTPSEAHSRAMSSVSHFASALVTCPDDMTIQHEVVSSLADCVRLLCSASNHDTFDIDNCASLAAYLIKHKENGLGAVSPLLLSSAYNDLATSMRTPTTGYREMLLRAAYFSSPSEPAIIKNLGFLLEQTGRVDEAEAMYVGYLDNYGEDRGVRVCLACLCPPHHATAEEAEERYLKILGSLEDLLRLVDSGHLGTGDDPTREIAQMPLGWPYLGREMKPLSEALGKVYASLYPDLTSGSLSSSLVPSAPPPRGVVKLGVVAEYAGNTSPGMLIQEALSVLSSSPGFSVTLFLPQPISTPFVTGMSSSGATIVLLDQHSVSASRSSILAAECDVLLFLALGMSPLTYYLSFSKLARIQVQYGHGHPITSGVPSVDYFVTSELFNGGNGGGDDDDEAEDAHTEQVVYFSTLTATLSPRPLPPPPGSSLSDFGLDANLRYYGCLQYTKKIHPSFDAALSSVLKSDTEGRVLMLEGARIFVDRWRSAGWTEDMIGRVVFTDR